MSAADRRLVARLRADEPARARWEALVAELARELDEGARARLAALPLEAEREPLAHWLVARLEQEAFVTEELRLRLALEAWRGRVDGCDLEFAGGGPRAGSAALARLARLAPFERESGALATGERLALGCAALLLERALERVDAELVLGEAAERTLVVELPDRAELVVGRYAGGELDRSVTALRVP